MERASRVATCLVTGGAGFIGSHIAEALVRRGDRVRVLDDLSTGSTDNFAGFADSVDFIRGDVRDAQAVRRATEGVQYVFHQAALVSVTRSVEDPITTHDIGITGTLNVLLAARDSGVRRVVCASSSSVYGDSPELPKRETQLPEPISPYAVAKLTGEEYGKVFGEIYGLETVNLRYFNIFGPRQDPTNEYAAVIPIFINAIVAGQRPTVYGDGEQTRDFTYVANVVQANLKAAEAPDAGGQAYNIACGQRYSLNRLLELICKVLGSAVEPIYADPRTGDVVHSQADIALARKDLGFEPAIDFEEGLRLTIEYYKGCAKA